MTPPGQSVCDFCGGRGQVGGEPCLACRGQKDFARERPEIIEPEPTADLLDRLDHNLEDFEEADEDGDCR